MAEGVRAVTGADYGISVTGVAGPDSDERGNAVGTVYIGLARPDGTLCRLCHFGKRSRERIRGQSATPPSTCCAASFRNKQKRPLRRV